MTEAQLGWRPLDAMRAAIRRSPLVWLTASVLALVYAFFSFNGGGQDGWIEPKVAYVGLGCRSLSGRLAKDRSGLPVPCGTPNRNRGWLGREDSDILRVP